MQEAFRYIREQREEDFAHLRGIVIVGQPAAGKTTVRRILQSTLGYRGYTASEILADYQNLFHNQGKPTGLNDTYWDIASSERGGSWVSEEALNRLKKEYIQNPFPGFFYEGTRRVEDILFLRQLKHRQIMFLGVVADRDIRLERFLRREGRSDRLRTPDVFDSVEHREGPHVDMMMRYCTHFVTNNGVQSYFENSLLGTVKNWIQDTANGVL